MRIPIPSGKISHLDFGKSQSILYPQPNVSASFLSSPPTLYHAIPGKQSDGTGRNLGSLPLPVSLLTVLHGSVSSCTHCLAIHTRVPCPVRDMCLGSPPRLLLPTCHWFGKGPRISGFKALNEVTDPHPAEKQQSKPV